MKLNFQQEALVLPGAVLSCCGDADAAALRVLLWLASDLSLYDKPKQLGKLADCDQKSLKAILQFWRMYGILSEEGESVPALSEAVIEKPVAASKSEDAKSEKTTKKQLLRRADELPNYTSTELSEILEKRAGVRTLVDEAQQMLGKMFNPGEVNILIGMLDYLGMSEEAVLLLLAHCKKIGKTNLRSIEKYAYTLVEKGITESEAMEEEIQRAELMHSFEGELRTLFGMSKRALTGRESKMISAWMSFGYGIDVVRVAYEMTIHAINDPSMPYANSILERWNANGWHTLAEIEEGIAAEKAKKAGNATELGNSFDTDDFFEAALKRSFESNDFFQAALQHNSEN